MQVLDDFCQALLGLILTGHIGELDALGGFYIDFCVALSQAEHHGVRAAGLIHHLLGHILPEADEQNQRQAPGEQKVEPGGGLLDHFAPGGNTGIQQALGQLQIGHHASLVDGFSVLFSEQDHILLGLDLSGIHLSFLHHGDEGVVVHLLDLALGQPGHEQEVE